MPALTTDRRTTLALVAALPAAMLVARSPDFDAALLRYREAKAAEQVALNGALSGDAWIDSIVARVDRAVDELVASPSPDAHSLALKVEILAAEYHGEVQPRHFIALAEDARRLV